MLIIMIMSMMCAYTSFHAMAHFAKNHRTLLANQIPLPCGKAPCASTFLRLSNRLDVQELCEVFNQLVLWVGTLENNKQSEIHQVQALLSLFEKAIFTLEALHKNSRVSSKE